MYSYAAVAVDDAGPTTVYINSIDPADPDFDLPIVRYALGTTQPATPRSGSAAGSTGNPGYKAQLPSDPLTTYSVSVFTEDTKGNVNPVPSTAPFTTRNGTGGVRQPGYPAAWTTGLVEFARRHRSWWAPQTDDLNAAKGRVLFIEVA